MKNYFKKFSIMFVMSLIIMLGCATSVFAADDGVIGTSNLNNTVENSAKVGDLLKLPEIGWKRYDDPNKNIIYTDLTTGAYSGSKISGYSYNSTQTQFTNGSCKFNFTGTQIRIIGLRSEHGSGAYSGKIGISIDNLPVETYSSVGTPQYQTLLYEKTGLSNTEHYLTITNSDSLANTYIQMDAIDIDSVGNLKTYNENISSISLDKSSMDLNVNDSQQLTATTTPSAVAVTWASSDTSIATVDTNGNVTAVKEGQATITATTTDGSNLSASCTVTVASQTIPTTGITLNKTSDSIVAGQTDTLVATTTPSAVGVTWTSSDSSIATVDSTGKITAIKAGTVIITASTSNGLTAVCALTVTNPTDNSGGTTTGASAIINIAHAKGDNTNNAGGEVSIIFNGLPDTTLSVVKTADVKSVYVGDTFTYTIVVTNTGSKTAKSVVINDSAPNHIQFMPSGITTTQGTVDPSSTSSNILVNVGDIPPLGTVTIKIPATVIL